MALWQLSATTLSGMLARGEVSAREVLRAHLDRIDDVNGRVNAFTEVLRAESAAAAEESDSRRSRREPRGPLDGVPVTIKECFDVQGRATTLGLPSWRDRVAARDAAMVQALREAGAVIVGRTNLSQTMLYPEASNPLFGRTANPWSLAHSPGGSSGGEAAAIAAGMSPLGLGTDIGGSIRTPAHFCGIAAFKPTLDRLPMRGYRTVNAGQEAVRGMCGPMARTVADLVLLLRAAGGPEAARLDPRVPPIAWDDTERVAMEGLRVGLYVDDGVLAASAAIARAVERAAAALRARGVDVVPFELPDVPGVLSDYLGALSADGGLGVRGALAGGEVEAPLVALRRVARIPAGPRRLASRAARAAGEPGLSLLLSAIGRKSVADLWRITEQLRAYRSTLLDSMDRRGVQAILAPPFATPALAHGASSGFTLAASYAIVFNVTQFPAGVVPVTRVRADEATRARTEDRLAARAAAVDAASAGLPIGVQIAARPWQDHVSLALMAAIEQSVSDDPEFPRTPVEGVGS